MPGHCRFQNDEGALEEQQCIREIEGLFGCEEHGLTGSNVIREISSIIIVIAVYSEAGQSPVTPPEHLNQAMA